MGGRKKMSWAVQILWRDELRVRGEGGVIFLAHWIHLSSKTAQSTG